MQKFPLPPRVHVNQQADLLPQPYPHTLDWWEFQVSK